MKKTLVALAALAAIGSASAQVTLYGKADVGLRNLTDNSAGTVDKGVEFVGNNYETSRFGLKGGTDLTGGIKAVFQLEQGFKLGDGISRQDDTTFNRVAMLGLTGDFGTVSAGLQWSPYDSAWGWDALEYNGFSAANNAWYGGAHGDNGTTVGQFGNIKNSIAYTTPNMSGFDATVMYSNNADKTATNSGTSYVGVGANYAAGPLSINFGYESTSSALSNPGSTLVAAAGDKTTAYVIGGAYNLGVATIDLAFQTANADFSGVSYKDQGYALGVAVPVSAAATVGLGYATETTTSSGIVPDGKKTGYGIQVIYNWTKQMAIYGGYTSTKSEALGVVGDSTATKLATGLRYNF